MTIATKAQDAMKENPDDGQIEEEKKQSDSDIDSDDASKGQTPASGEEISIEAKVDAIFMACDSNKDGVLNIAEAKPYIQNVAAELLGIEEGEAGEAALKDLFEEIGKNGDGKISKEELIKHLKELEAE